MYSNSIFNTFESFAWQWESILLCFSFLLLLCCWLNCFSHFILFYFLCCALMCALWWKSTSEVTTQPVIDDIPTFKWIFIYLTNFNVLILSQVLTFAKVFSFFFSLFFSHLFLFFPRLSHFNFFSVTFQHICSDTKIQWLKYFKIAMNRIDS